MRDFFQYRVELSEMRFAKTKSAMLKQIEELWDDNAPEIAKGRSAAEIDLHDRDFKKYVDPKTINTTFPKVDWKKFAREDFDLFKVYYEDLWHAYT